jgi:small subunit ribosomal protein S18
LIPNKMSPKKTGKRRSTLQKPRKVGLNCPFCKTKANPDYKNYDDLAKYLTDRAKILGKDRTGVCAKHQRRLGVAIKRARHLGLLPFR